MVMPGFIEFLFVCCSYLINPLAWTAFSWFFHCLLTDLPSLVYLRGCVRVLPVLLRCVLLLPFIAGFLFAMIFFQLSLLIAIGLVPGSNASLYGMILGCAVIALVTAFQARPCRKNLRSFISAKKKYIDFSALQALFPDLAAAESVDGGEAADG